MMYPYGDPFSMGVAHLVTHDWKKSWRSTTTPQKIVRLGLVGGLVGTAIYLYVTGRRSVPSASPPPPTLARTADRGTYR
jgi:hypothetical protein